MNVETKATPTVHDGQKALQWSHVLMNVETGARTPRAPCNERMLQWSHVLMNVETNI